MRQLDGSTFYKGYWRLKWYYESPLVLLKIIALEGRPPWPGAKTSTKKAYWRIKSAEGHWSRLCEQPFRLLEQDFRCMRLCYLDLNQEPCSRLFAKFRSLSLKYEKAQPEMQKGQSSTFGTLWGSAGCVSSVERPYIGALYHQRLCCCETWPFSGKNIIDKSGGISMVRRRPFPVFRVKSRFMWPTSFTRCALERSKRR